MTAMGEGRIPKLSDEAWAILGVLYRAARGGPDAPSGFTSAYAELGNNRFAHFTPPDQWSITQSGEAVLQAVLHERYDGIPAEFHLEEASHTSKSTCP